MTRRTGQTRLANGIELAVLAVLAGCAATPGQTLTAAQITAPPQIAPVAEQSLVGTSATALSAEFGPPALRRVDGASQVWLYHSPVCGLNLILFPDQAGVARVAAAVPNGDDGVNGDPASCMASLQRGAPSQTAALERATSS